ncbi:unnamed protein product [Calicophoron daubneyi]|uniref:Chromosome transmission fidelity protein 8 n=1 Tax=Calicophoron daubneyi TaxID=300641 RepID=A0AAV2TIC8_CALDB
MIVKVRSPHESAEEWVLIELQGDIISKTGESLSEKHLGDVHFSAHGEPVFIIGHHILFGKVTDMEKPFVVTEKVSTVKGAELHVIAVVRKKLIFKTRPKPIIFTNLKKASQPFTG